MASKQSDGEKKKSKLPMVLVALAVLGGAYKFVGPGKATPPAPAPAAHGEAGEHPPIEEGAVIALPELTVNLADAGPRYLRAGIALILEKGVPTEEMKEELPIASDVAIDVLSAKTFAELNAPGAKQAVKEELSKKVREAYHDEKVARVIFTTFVMQ